jgi:hypothetical protein
VVALVEVRSCRGDRLSVIVAHAEAIAKKVPRDALVFNGRRRGLLPRPCGREVAEGHRRLGSRPYLKGVRIASRPIALAEVFSLRMAG